MTRPFYPSRHVGGPYRLPAAVHDLLGSRLQGRRNADAIYLLAMYLARFQSARRRLTEAFPVVRLAADGTGGLANTADLGLSEKRIRTALTALEDIGFLVREIAKGNGYQATPGGLRKAPIRFRFGPDFWELFSAANAVRARHKTKGPRGSGFAAKIDSRPIEKPAPQPAPAVPKRGHSKPKGPGWADNTAKVAATEALARLKDRPLPKMSPAALATFKRRLW